MTRSEIISNIATTRSEDQCFIKLFKTGHELVDFDQIDVFIGKTDLSTDIDEFELLTIEQMWQTILDLDPDKLTRSGSGENEVIEWIWTDRDGNEKRTIFPFTPEGIMDIVNDEFFA